MKYGQSIVWTKGGGVTYTFTVSGCESHEQAIMEAIGTARRQGWTYPRWWEFWRWGDTRPLDFARETEAKP
jgi:hypothetical protein